MSDYQKYPIATLLIWLVGEITGSSAFFGPNPAVAAQKFTNTLNMEFIQIEQGSFMMGQQGGGWDEITTHKVTISNTFFMSATEVTNAQYERFDPNHRNLRGKSGFSKEDNEAVVFVTWHQATEFCHWLSEKEGKPYRLPTEAEWEYACRAGTTSLYNTGDKLPGNYQKNQAELWQLKPLSLKVGSTDPNPWGLHDMHGNVEEWCYDWYGPYEKGDQINPLGRIQGSFKVSRGGSHSTPVYYLRSANRMGTLPDDFSCLIGFRVVMGQLPKTEPLPMVEPSLNQQNVNQQIPQSLKQTLNEDKPYFDGPIQYVHVPLGSKGPIFSEHNHDPALVNCPNGDLLAIWYSCLREAGRELTVVASRLRYGTRKWEPASVFWDAPDRNDHAPAMWYDGSNTIYHFNGLGIAATWANMALIMRTSTDSGATWSKARLIAPEHELRHQPVESVFRTSEGFIVLPCDAVTGGTGGTAVHISRNEGKTWTDPGRGRTPPKFEAGQTGAWIAGIHAGVTQLSNGSLMALGRGDNINGRMPMSISKDMGRTWTYSASEFPPLGSGQRLILKKLLQSPILLISFTDRKKGMMMPDYSGIDRRMYGMFAALSYDDGKTWPYKRLITAGRPPKEIDGGGNTGRFTMDDTHAEPRGYLAAKQTPNGLIHLITSKQYYVFNLAWLKQPAEVKKQHAEK